MEKSNKKRINALNKSQNGTVMQRKKKNRNENINNNDLHESNDAKQTYS